MGVDAPTLNILEQSENRLNVFRWETRAWRTYCYTVNRALRMKGTPKTVGISLSFWRMCLGFEYLGSSIVLLGRLAVNVSCEPHSCRVRCIEAIKRGAPHRVSDKALDTVGAGVIGQQFLSFGEAHVDARYTIIEV